MAWKREDAVDVEAVWDMGEVATEEEVVLFTGEGGDEESLHVASATGNVHER